MKHLKPFNEDLNKHDQLFKEDLQEFCEMNLAYLLDEAELRIVESPGGYEELLLIRIKLDEAKQWDEIKDHMIPFLTRLNNKYQITPEVFNTNSTYGKGGDIRFYIGINTDEIYPNANYVEVSVKNLIDDLAVTSIRLYRCDFDDIRLYVKIPKKSILTKIKSFFK
jgi:hypothetical protein